LTTFFPKRLSNSTVNAVTARTPAPLPVWSGRSKQPNWLFIGLVCSLVLHTLLCVVLYRIGFQPEAAVGIERRPPPTFKVKSVEPESKSLDSTTASTANEPAKPNPDQTNVQLPDEQKSFDTLLQEMQATAAVPDDTRNVLPDKPQVEQTNLNSVIKEIERTTAQSLERSPDAKREQSLINNVPDSGRPQPALTGTELATSTTIKRPNNFNALAGDSAGPRTDRAPGFSDLDQLLSRQGPLGSGTQIRMPDDQLFAFASAALQPSEALQKLGTLLRRNPDATFVIEGYTDSIGDPEYNLNLSQERADSVRDYLIQSGVDPTHIRAHGFGATNFLVAPRPVALVEGPELEAEIARQRLNRRVVVVVH
jgi:outer membrane protein OmpA-like peptidoglycan-associated protein